MIGATPIVLRFSPTSTPSQGMLKASPKTQTIMVERKTTGVFADRTMPSKGCQRQSPHLEDCSVQLMKISSRKRQPSAERTLVAVKDLHLLVRAPGWSTDFLADGAPLSFLSLFVFFCFFVWVFTYTAHPNEIIVHEGKGKNLSERRERSCEEPTVAHPSSGSTGRQFGLEQ